MRVSEVTVLNNRLFEPNKPLPVHLSVAFRQTCEKPKLNLQYVPLFTRAQLKICTAVCRILAYTDSHNAVMYFWMLFLIPQGKVEIYLNCHPNIFFYFFLLQTPHKDPLEKQTIWLVCALNILFFILLPAGLIRLFTVQNLITHSLATRHLQSHKIILRMCAVSDTLKMQFKEKLSLRAFLQNAQLL